MAKAGFGERKTWVSRTLFWLSLFGAAYHVGAVSAWLIAVSHNRRIHRVKEA